MPVNPICQNLTSHIARTCMQCQNLTSSTRRIQVGNGQYVGVLFVTPIIMTIKNHRFEIFTLVSEIHENVRLSVGNQKISLN